MKFSALHISDLHRDPDACVTNVWLLDSLERDFAQFSTDNIARPTICLVSGDLVSGAIGAGAEDVLRQQFAQAEDFLVSLADRFFNGDRQKIVICPGNHDISVVEVMASTEKIGIPDDLQEKKKLVGELSRPGSMLRWSWKDLCFFRIIDQNMYLDRFKYFKNLYDRFYSGVRTYSLDPVEQFDIFEFDDLGFAVVALNSCFSTDIFYEVGDINSDALVAGRQRLASPNLQGWVKAALWHHDMSGDPGRTNYMRRDLLQYLIESGVGLAFHGHGHRTECYSERYALGKRDGCITVMSASTLCGGARELKPGIPRGYNIIEIDIDQGEGCLHQRGMVNAELTKPMWGPGHIISTNTSSQTFAFTKPTESRIVRVQDFRQEIEKAETLIGHRKWAEAIQTLEVAKDFPLARIFLMEALVEQNIPAQTISLLWPPRTPGEAVVVGFAIYESGNSTQADAFMRLEFIRTTQDASVKDVIQRLLERWKVK